MLKKLDTGLFGIYWFGLGHFLLKEWTVTEGKDTDFNRWKWFEWVFVLLITAFFNFYFDNGLAGAAFVGTVTALVHHFTFHRLFIALFPLLHATSQKNKSTR